MHIGHHISLRLRKLAKISSIRRILDRALVLFFSATVAPFRWFSSHGGSTYPMALRFLRSNRLMVIPDHYYWPLVNPEKLARPLDQVRNLPGIDFALSRQVDFIKKLTTGNEIQSLDWNPDETLGQGELAFSLGNGAYEAGDAEILHHVVRHFKPQTVIEIGSGH